MRNRQQAEYTVAVMTNGSNTIDSLDELDLSVLDGTDWVEVLRRSPQFAEHCPWELLHGWDWVTLLADMPIYADKCDWGSLRQEELTLLFTKQMGIKPLYDRYMTNDYNRDLNITDRYIV